MLGQILVGDLGQNYSGGNTGIRVPRMSACRPIIWGLISIRSCGLGIISFPQTSGVAGRFKIADITL
jgi:hypothetical protein